MNKELLTNIMTGCSTLLNELNTPSNRNKRGEVYDLIETLSYSYIRKAFDQLSAETGTDFTHDEIGKTLLDKGFHPNVAKFVQMLIPKLARETRYNNAHHNQEMILNKLKHDFPEANPELQLIEKIGSCLLELLNDKINIIEILFENSSQKLLNDLYHHSIVFNSCNRVIAKSIEAYMSSRRNSKPLTILEIGAGTGATTAAVLPEIPSNSKYMFTDISSFFFTEAKNKFSEFTCVDYLPFNAELSCVEQGVPQTSIDIVIAANVLHATTDISKTLDNAKELLNEGGILIILETTQQLYYIDLMVGLLDGWTKFSDHSIRPSYPLLDENTWLKLLNENGLHGTSLFSQLTPGDILKYHSVFIAINQTG